MPRFDITLPKPLSFVKTLGVGGKTNKTAAATSYTYAYVKDKDTSDSDSPSASEFGFRSSFTTRLAQTFGGLSEKPRGRPRHRASVSSEQPTTTPADAELRKVLSSPCLHPEHEPLVHEEAHVATATERSLSPPSSDTDTSSDDDTAVPSEGDSTPVNSLSRSPSYKKNPELIAEELLSLHLEREPSAPLPDEREFTGVSLVHKLSTQPVEFYNPVASGFPVFVPFRGAFTCEDDEGPL